MESLILLVGLVVLWLVSSRRWRRRFVQPFALVVAAYLAIASPVGIALAIKGLTVFLPADEGHKVDAIVVVGRGEPLRPRRHEVAVELWQANRARKVFVSGMTDAPLIAASLASLGVPKSAIDGETCSQSTLENALFSAAILRPQGVQQILLVTDPPHLLRALRLFENFGFKVTPAASPLPDYLSAQEQLRLISREYVGLLTYLVRGFVSPLTDAARQQAEAEAVQKIASWDCRVKKF